MSLSRLLRRRRSPAVLPRHQRSPLRCTFVITSMPVGGAETLLVNLMRRMDPSVVTPEVVCLKEPGPLGNALADEFPVHSHLIGSKWDVGVIFRLARLFRQREIDAVITVGAGDKMFWGRLAAFVAGTPVIGSALHSTGWPDGVGRMNRLLTPITDAFIGVAQSHGEFLVDFERFPESKVHVIRNGIDCDRFRPNRSAREKLRRDLGIAPESCVIGIVAALREEKNHTLLVRAARQIADARDPSRQPHWVIVGDGPERSRIETLASELGVSDNVHLLGTRHDTDQILAGLDIFTLCSLNEASPVSILESLSCEVPVVASDVGSISESVIPEQTGLLFASEDIDSMVAAIDRLIDDASLRAELGKRGRQLVEQTGSLESMVQGYQDLIVSQYDRFARENSKAAGRSVATVAAEKTIPAASSIPTR